MKFATIGHLREKSDIGFFPKSWRERKNLLISPEIDVQGTKGYLTGLTLTAHQMMSMPVGEVRDAILDVAVFVQEEFGVDLIQLGALTTSVTEGGVWMIRQKRYSGFVNHGDSYTALVTCQNVFRVLELFSKKPADQGLAIVGAYGVIGEAVSKILVPLFHKSLLVGRRIDKLEELQQNLKGKCEISCDLEKIRDADVVVAATSHPTALLGSEHLKRNAVVVDVSQPPNLSVDVCQQRPDIVRVDGGLVSFSTQISIPGLPHGRNFACIVEVIMQAMENEHKNHVGSIDLKHLKKTERWAEKYGFTLNELTNFGKPISSMRE